LDLLEKIWCQRPIQEPDEHQHHWLFDRITPLSRAIRLANSDEKIVNIALDAGFGSMSQFYEIFHRATGLTPQKWRDAQ